MGLSQKGSTATSTSRIRPQALAARLRERGMPLAVGDPGAARDGDGAPLAGATVSKALDLITRVRACAGDASSR